MLWWSDDLKTGVESIDKQHKSIFHKANEIFNLGVGIDPNEFKKIISFLMSYTNNHFMEEEQLMIDYEYEELVEHRKKHNYFVEEIYKIYLKSSKKIDEELLILLKVLVIEWLAEHINVWDRKFVNYMKKKD